MKDIELILGSNVYPRLRIGIGGDFLRGRQVDYVLGRFTKDEFEQLPSIMDRACEAILSFGTVGIERTMTQYNKVS